MSAIGVSFVLQSRPVCTRRIRSLPRPRLQALNIEDLTPGGVDLETEVDSESFYQQFDSLLNSTDCRFLPGERVKGRVIDTDESGVYVEFGGKETGFCSNSDLALQSVTKPDEILPVNAVEEFEVVSAGLRSKYLGGYITALTRVPDLLQMHFKRLQLMSDLKIKTQVEVLEKNRGGYRVRDAYGFEGFLPGRQAAVNPGMSGLTDDPLIGQEIIVRILDVQPEEENIVVSQRGVLDGTSDVSKFKIGTVLEGVVEGVMPYGVFVSVGRVAGLLHITQVSGHMVKDINTVFKPKDRVKVMVVSFDELRGRLSLSTKKLEPSPGDMLTNRALVDEKAEEMAAKFRQELESSEARSREGGGDLMPIGPEITIR